MAQHTFNNPSSSTSSSFGGLDFRQVLVAVRERWIGGLTLSLAISAALVWFQLRQTPEYQAYASLAFEMPQSALNLPSVTDRNPLQRFSGIFLTNHLSQIVSREMVEKVAAGLNDEEKALLLTTAAPLRGISRDPDQRLIAVLNAAIRVRPVPESLLIRLTARGPDPDAAALIANAFAEQYLDFLFDQNATSNNSAIQFLERQSVDLSAQLEANERALQTYRENYNLVSLEEKQNVVLDRLKALSGQVTSARVARITVETKLQQTQLLRERGGSPQELAALANNAALGSTQQQIDNLESDYAVLGQRYGRRHPKMMENRRQLEALTTLRQSQIENAIAELTNQLSNARAQEDQLLRELAESEAENLRLDKIGVRYNVLRREVDTTRATYSQILTRLNETRISAQLESDVFRLNDRAFPIRQPVVPNRNRIFTTAGILGIAILFGYPLLMEILINRIRSWSDVESHLNANLLGEIAQYSKIPTADRAHILLRDVNEEAREGFRALYSQLKLSSQVDLPKALLVTSSLPNEGKSFIAANLAAAFASHQHRTLLIDGDLRRPVQHRNWGRKNDHGVLKWLESGSSLENPRQNPDLGIHEIAEHLDFMAAGGSTRDTTSLLEANAPVPQLIKSLRSLYDVIIIDSPPAGVFPDSLAWAESADELVFVTRFNTVTKQHGRQVLDTLRKTGLSVPGVVLNGMPTGRTAGVYYSSYGYNYHGSKYRADYARSSEHDS